MRYFHLVILVLLTSLTACAPIWQTRPVESAESLWATRHAQLTQLEQWKIKGRTVITQDREGWNAGLRWQESDGEYQIKLEGPFAQGGVTLEGNEKVVVLTLSDGQKKSARTPEVLLAETLGWNLPVSALRYWVRGLPFNLKGIQSMKYDEKGRLTHLVQEGWEIKFLRYIPFEEYSMPSKIFIKHPELSVRVAITDWSRP